MFAWIEQKEDTKHLVQATLSRTGLHEIRKVRIKVRRQELTITTYHYQDQFFQWSLKVSNLSWGLLRQRAAQKIACRRQLEQDRKSMEKLYSGEERETSKSSRWQQNSRQYPAYFCDAVSWMCSFHSNVSADSKSSFFKRFAVKAKPPPAQEQWRSSATSSRGKMISRSLRPTSMNKSCSDALEVWSCQISKICEYAKMILKETTWVKDRKWTCSMGYPICFWAFPCSVCACFLCSIDLMWMFPLQHFWSFKHVAKKPCLNGCRYK